MQYVIAKSSRIPTGPYFGPSCEAAGVPEGKIYDSKEEAITDAKKLSAINPVGFKIWTLEEAEKAEAKEMFLLAVAKILRSKSMIFSSEIFLALDEYFAQFCVHCIPSPKRIEAIAQDFIDSLKE